MRRWWQLPGPQRFVEQVLGDLREGRNVVLCLPEHGPQDHGLFSELASAFQHTTIERLPADGDTEPLLLFARLYKLPADAALTAHALVQSEAFAGRVFRLEGLTMTTWLRWRDFLENYEHVARNIPLLDRTLFIAPLIGLVAALRPESQVGISVREWDDVVGSLDILLFAAQLLPPRRDPPTLNRLLAATIAHVALFDPEVALRLAERPPSVILEPTPLLLEIAKDRSWTADISDSWASGTRMTFEGEPRAHAVLKALNGDLARRLWRAHVSVLFPEIEERRQLVLQRLGKHLALPWDTGTGIVTDARYLEIGHIAYQLEGLKHRVPREDRMLVQKLKSLRDRLAHLDAAPLDLILDVLSSSGDDKPDEGSNGRTSG